MSIAGFNIEGNVEKYDYNSLDNIPESEKWELLQSSDDVELRSIGQTCDGTYSRYVVALYGKAKTANATWDLYRAGYQACLFNTVVPYQGWGGGSWFFIELHENAPVLISSSANTWNGNGVGELKQAFFGTDANKLKTFSLKPTDSTLEYDTLSIRIWGVKS